MSAYILGNLCCSSFYGTVNIIDWVNNDALVIKWVKKKKKESDIPSTLLHLPSAPDTCYYYK